MTWICLTRFSNCQYKCILSTSLSMKSKESVLACQTAVALGGSLESFLGGEAFVVRAAGDNALTGGVTILETDKSEAEHEVGKAVVYEGEGTLGIFVGRQEC